jgi:hypothetical protein
MRGVNPKDVPVYATFIKKKLQIFQPIKIPLSTVPSTVFFYLSCISFGINPNNTRGTPKDRLHGA